ncbi:hypothetical protein [Enterovibrio norvegicus]|uniref:hypothetical protein n=1 Tax=Enterovibrio norvegicus TaxID=188144 RepID=UPI003553EDB3
MSKQLEIVVISAFRCRGGLRKPGTNLTVGEDVTNSEARSLVGQKKAAWVTEETAENKPKNTRQKPKKEAEDGAGSDDAGDTGGGDE